MADKDFQVKNGLVVNSYAVSVNSTGIFFSNNRVVNATHSNTIANNTLFVGTVAAVDVVSSTQLQSNILYFVNTSQLSANLSNYQTTAGLGANIAAYTGNINNASIVNASSYSVGSSWSVNSSVMQVGLGTTINASSVNAVSYTIGSTWSVNSTVMQVSTGTLVNAATVNATSYLVGSSWSVNSTVMQVSTGTLVNAATVNATSYLVGSSWSVNSTVMVMGTGVGLRANGSLGTANQALITNGSSVYWGNVATNALTGNSSTNDFAFLECGQTVNGDFTTTATKNYVSGGPITVNPPAVVTVTTGSRWVIV